MSKRMTTILLMISMAFNLAVLGVFIFIHTTGRTPFPPPPPRHERGMLDAPPGGAPRGQTKWMADCMREGMANCQPQRDSFQVDRMQFIQTLKAAKFNETASRDALEKSLLAHAQMEKSLGENLIAMRKKMTAEQAKQFFERRFGHRQKFSNERHNPTQNKK